MTLRREVELPQDAVEPIAVVGIGCRLPGRVSTVDDLLSVFREGRDCITEIPSDRWDAEAFFDPDPLTPGKTYVRYGGFVEDIDRFDAAFFGISDAEAARMDPQQRMVLQAVWHALEYAGQSAEELSQSTTGVFLAMMNTNNYSQMKGAFEGIEGITGYDAMGDAMSITAGRVSHFLGLEGPCLALDTACSGSMVATHLARQSILAGECDSAIVAGVGAILHPGIHIAFSKVGLMSRSGRCRAFDESADGYIRGEGCVAVLLRRQSLALERGDNIIATIVGTAINQDGHTPALTAPNGHTQEKVIRTALARLGINPNEIGYVEAHGTGTPVGDPIEMNALANVYGPGRSDQQPLYVGSAKSNFGHIEAGAGLLGLVKAALSLERETIFPSLHFTRLNPNIDIGRAPLKVPTSPIPWPRGERRRMAGVNSFGYSGTNAHAILREAPLPTDAATQHAETTRPAEMVVLSAKTGAVLQELADHYGDFLGNETSPSLQNVAFTAATGRTHLRHRLAVVGTSKQDIVEKLTAWREGRIPKGLATGQATLRRKLKTALVFTGQGAQHAGMGRQLYDTEPRFKAAIDRCAALMDKDLGAPLLDVLYGASSAQYLTNTRYVQPALFAVEYALADLLRHWGVEPDFVIGHSVGELVAACVAGILDLEGAARFVVVRGRLMGQLPRGGKMLALDATSEEALEWLRGHEDRASLATVNGPRSVVVSGQDDAVDAVAALAIAAGRRTRELEVSHAFHSPLMEPILEELTAAAADLIPSLSSIPVASNVTGTFFEDRVEPGYWSTHVRRPVLFYEGMRTIIEAGCSVVIEVGPHPALTPAIAAGFDTSKTRCLTTLTRDHEDVARILETLASLHVIGMPLRLDRLFWSRAYRRVPLPLYPFRRDRHWIEADVEHYEAPAKPSASPQEQPAVPQIKTDLHPLLGEAVEVAPRRFVFRASPAAQRPWVDHRVLGTTVFPGTAYLETAARGFAALEGRDWRPVVMRDVGFDRPLVLRYGKAKPVALTLDKITNKGGGGATFEMAAATENGASDKYCLGRIAGAGDKPEQVSMESLLGSRQTAVPIPTFYGELRNRGLEYGASFSTVRELWAGKPGSGEAIGRVAASLHDSKADEHPFMSSVLLDGCLHVFGAALETLGENNHGGAFVPTSIQCVTWRRELRGPVWSHVTVRVDANGRAAVAHIRVVDDSGDVLADIEGLELRRTSSLAVRDGSGNGHANGGAAGGLDSRERLVERLRGLSKQERVEAVAKSLAAEVKDILGQAAEDLDLDNLDPSTAFMEIGLDSLLVTELQRRIQEKLDFRFQPMQGLDYQSIESLAEYILNEVLALDSVDQTNGRGEPALSR